MSHLEAYVQGEIRLIDCNKGEIRLIDCNKGEIRLIDRNISRLKERAQRLSCCDYHVAEAKCLEEIKALEQKRDELERCYQNALNVHRDIERN